MEISADSQHQDQRKSRPHPEQSLRCPRCDSANTKFCYYNNYSLSQPRYFCKGCRRYWTKGGSLRNVPVGGGCRKNKRSSPISVSNPSFLSKKVALNDHKDNHPTSIPPLHPITYEPNHGLTLAFSNIHRHDHFHIGNPNPSPSPMTNGSAFLVEPSHQSFYYGLEGGDDGIRSMLSFEAGCSDSTSVANNANSDANVGSFGMESGRGYWNGGGSSNSSWHGLINGSLL